MKLISSFSNALNPLDEKVSYFPQLEPHLLHLRVHCMSSLILILLHPSDVLTPSLTVMSSMTFRDWLRHDPSLKGGSDFDNAGGEAGWGG